MFFFKTKKIILDCFTPDPFNYEYCKPDRATKFTPKWWKELPLNGDLSLKHCRGFKQYFSKGIILPLPYSLRLDINTNEDKTFIYEVSNNIASINGDQPGHPEQQYRGFVDSNYQSLKINLGWKFRSNKFVEFVWSDPIWCRPYLEDITILPAVVDYKYQWDTLVNIFFKYRSEKRTVFFEANTPIVCLHPLTENKIELRYHLVDEKYFNSFTPFRASMSLNSKWGEQGKVVSKDSYSNRKKFIDKVEERNSLKCPFTKK